MEDQYDEWMAHLRRHSVSRRTLIRGTVGVAAGGLLLGPGWVSKALPVSGTIADGFAVNGRHLSFGADPSRHVAAGAQLINLNRYSALPPNSVRVWLDYGTSRFYGTTIEAEIRGLITHVPVWDGKPGVLRASRTLNAEQFLVHAQMAHLTPGTRYHYRFRYTAGKETGVTADATFRTAPGPGSLEPFTFTAFGDEGIPGPDLDRDPSLLPNVIWEEWNDGDYAASDPDDLSYTHVSPSTAVITQITKVRNLANGTPTRFHLVAGDISYAQSGGNIEPIINPDGPNGSQPTNGNTPRPPAGSGGWDFYDPWVWSSWFPMVEPSSAFIPWMVTTGNHEPELFSAQVAADPVTIREYEKHGYGGLAKRFDFPPGAPGIPSVYAFAYGNVGVLSLDANEVSWELQGLLGYSHGEQLKWAERALAAWRSTGAVDFIVAQYHECAFTTGNGHCSDGGVRSAFAPLFAKYKVDLAIQGHNHLYERTNPLTYDPATNSARSTKQAYSKSPAEPAVVYPETEGTTYVTVGTAGTQRHQWTGKHETSRNFAVGPGSGTVVVGDAKTKTGPWVWGKDFSQRYETVDWSQARYEDYGFIALDVTPAAAGKTTTMMLRFINEQGRELDRVIFSRTARR
jgi:hypothetical protein